MSQATAKIPDNALWTPQPGRQTEFHTRTEYEVMYGGAAGGGKTASLIAEQLRWIHRPTYRGIFFRRTFPQLQQPLERARALYKSYKGRYSGVDHVFRFPAGSTVRFGHLQHEFSKLNYQSDEYQVVEFDELTHFTETQYLYLMSRIRKSDPSIHCQLRSGTNPGGIGHAWVKRRFVDPAPLGNQVIRGERPGQERIFIPAKLSDNLILMAVDPEYGARLDLLPPVERAMLRDGRWDLFAGQAFPEWSQDVHICQPFKVPGHWPIFASLDWGYSKPFSLGVWAIDEDERFWRIFEWYGWNGQADQGLRMIAPLVARMFRKKCERWGVLPEYITADPACWSRQGHGTLGPGEQEVIEGPTIAESFQSEGWSMIPAHNDRIQGKMQFHMRLAVPVDPLEGKYDPAEGLEIPKDDLGELELYESIKRNRRVENPMVMVFSHCTQFIRTIPELILDEKQLEDVETAQEDHIYDEARYAFMTRQMAARFKEKPPPDSFAEVRRRLVEAKKKSKRTGRPVTDYYRH